MTVIFDLDGTIALIDHRRHLVEPPDSNNEFPWKPDWDEFYRRCTIDKPNIPVILSLKALKDAGHTINIYSGRSDMVMMDTLSWLKEHLGDYANGIKLRMRSKKDYTPDEKLKEDWMNADFPDKSEVLCVFDDRDKVVAMWRRNGIPCFQVAPGKF
jgi:hypothetical protein